MSVNQSFKHSLLAPLTPQDFFAVTLVAGEALPAHLHWQAPLTAQIMVAPALLLDNIGHDIPRQDVILSCRLPNKKIPLVWRWANGVVFGLNMVLWQEMMQQESYRPVHGKPFYASLPFHYKNVPAFLRTNAEYLVQLLRSRSNNPTIFTPHNIGGELLTALWQGESQQKGYVLLTHDMESAAGYDWIQPILEVEGSAGWTAEWFFVPRLYPIHEAALDHLMQQSHEIGLHGIWHSNAEAFLPMERLRQELIQLRPFLQRFSIQGYRGPGWFRTPTIYQVLAEFFLYDATTLDNDFSCPAMAGGVASSRPFRRKDGLVVMPCSLPFEAPLFRGVTPDQLVDYWWPKIDYLQRAGGQVLINTHPEPGYLARPGMLQAYHQLLQRLKNAGWQGCLPRHYIAGMMP